MKRKVVIVVVVVAVLALALPVLNLIVGPPANPLMDLAPDDPLSARVVATISKKCVSCHTTQPQMPYYSRLPVASSMIRRDIREGTTRVNYLEEFHPAAGHPVSEVTLAKTEYVARDNSMPPRNYLLMHWNHALTSEEREAILEWTSRARIEHYADAALPPTLQASVVRPIPALVEFDEKKAALGDVLFHDVRLSGDDTVSCATCHDLAKGGTDQLQFSLGVDGQMGGINAPTVYNSGYQILQFWDGRAADLKEQAAGPVANPIEMAAEWDEVVQKLHSDEVFRKAFAAVYPEGLSKDNITDAIAEFEETLVTPHSAFDRYLMGDGEALSEDQKGGYELFTAYRCDSCHVGPAMGGQSFEKMGLYADYFQDRGESVEAHPGRFGVTANESDLGKFKVPTLRNIALTYPYLHDGSTSDLAEVVGIMAHYQVGREITDADAALVADFLESLTGEYEGQLLQ